MAVASAGAVQAQPVHATRQTSQLVFHYDAGARKGMSHVVVALFDATTGERISTAEVQATVTLVVGVVGVAASAEFEHRAPGPERSR